MFSHINCVCFIFLKCHDVTRFTVFQRIADVEIVVKDMLLIVWGVAIVTIYDE